MSVCNSYGWCDGESSLWCASVCSIYGACQQLTQRVCECRLAFLLIALLDVAAVISSSILFFRTRHIYKIEHAELHQHDEGMHHHHHTSFGSFNLGHVPSPSDVDSSDGH